MKRAALLLLIVPFAVAARPRAQQPPLSSPPAATTADEKPDEGIPVTSDLVKRKCSGCHRADDKGRMTRISYRRTTPEGWEQTLKRMITLNNLKIDQGEAREVVRYLADHQGLAPEEAKPAAFEVERRQIDYQYADKNADKDKQLTEETCIACHSMGRVISQRRTKQEWELLVAMHRGYYWLSDFQAFRRTGPARREPGGDGPPPDTRHPMDVAIAHLSTAFPLTTPEWAAWAANMRPPQLQGKWALSGYQAGKGPIFGQVTIAPAGGSDSGEFTTEITYAIPATGEHVKRTGKSIVYTGFQWRGRSTATTGDERERELREVLFVDRDWRHASGRWFTGAYDEFGIDVQLQRVGSDPVLSGAGTMLLKAGGAQDVALFGANLPSRVAATELNFGPGITVDRVVSAAPEQLVVSVAVAKGAAEGRRSVFLNGATGEATVAVSDAIDYIKVTPQAGLARVGGGNFPKQFQQFEAIAYANGPDGKPDTKDDVELGPVSAAWATEEYTATFDDDDKDFVGTIDAKTGLFTPNLDGPNPKRKHNSNNYGDVWVVASFQAPPSPIGAARTLKARAHLLVTVPLYIKFEEPEVSR